MNDIKALVSENAINMPSDAKSRIMSAIGRRGIAQISPEREPGLFLLYCCGDDIETIAAKTNFPMDVVWYSAVYYKWQEKAKLLDKTTTPMEMQKSLVNTILTATVISIQKELGDVIAGRKDASDCPLIPKNMKALESLIKMVADVNKVPESAPTSSTIQTIHAQNVMINQGDQKQLEESPEKQATRMIMLKALEKA